MKMRDVISSEKCFVKDTFNEFDERKEKNYYNGIVLRELFKKYGLNYTKKDVVALVKDTMPSDLFHTSREDQINTLLLVLRLLRFQEYYAKQISSTATVHKGGITFVSKHHIEVDYNFIVEDGNFVNLVKVRNSKCQMSKQGRSVHTKIADSMELYLLQLAAEELFPNKICEVTEVFLRHPKDDGENLVPTSSFEDKKTVVKTSFVGAKRTEMEQRLDDAVSGKSKHECKDCSDCAYKIICLYEENKTKLLALPKKAKAAGKVLFTKAQKEVILAGNGIYRVLAGAGSGKTTCIANRICELIKNGTSPFNILLITFTTKGVDEMREKIEYWLKRNKINVNVKDLNIFTFNGFGFELVKKEYARFGYTAEPTLLEYSERIRLLKELLDTRPEIDGFNYAHPTLSLPHAKGVVLVMDEYLRKIKMDACTYPEEVKVSCGIRDLDVAKEIFALYKEFTEHMKLNNLVDYMDQVNLCYEILKDPNCLKQYGFEHVIVDEFQDSDNLQINILMLLEQFAYFKSLMVVGDDSQAIFSWRGATARNIINFKDIFPFAMDIPLMENFRSTQEICDLANFVNDINRDKVPKSLVSTRKGDKPKLFCLQSVSAFVDKMLECITYFGIDFSDVALIARNKKELLQMQELLVSRNVPCVLSVTELLIDNAVVKHLIDFAKFLQDGTSDLYFAEFLQIYDGDNFKKQTKTSLGAYVQSNLDDFTNELLACNTEEEKINLVLSKFDFIATTDRATKSLCEILRSKKFLTLYDMAQFMIDMETYKADYFIEKVDEYVNAITLTTAHSSKGREWKAVGIYLDTFSYPSSYDYNAVKNQAQFEEERRLLFVAITRAKDYLFLAGDSNHTAYKEVAKGLNS